MLRQAGAPRYRHILVDEAQDLHPSQWRLLRAAVAPGPDDLFIAADPHQRIYDNRVSLASMRISVRGRSRRLSLNYRTTQEILTWAVPLLGADPVTGLDGEVDSLLGYRSPMHGPRPQLRMAATRSEEFGYLAEQIRSWLAVGIEPQAIGVTARSASLVREAREMLKADGIMTIPLSGRGSAQACPGRHHARDEGPGVPGRRGHRRRARAGSRTRGGHPGKRRSRRVRPGPAAGTLRPVRGLHSGPGPSLRIRAPASRAHSCRLASQIRHRPVATALRRPARKNRARSPPPRAKVSMRELLWLREDSWRPRLRGASLVAEADLRPDHTRQVAAVLGRLYANLQDPRTEGESLLLRWPACLAAAMAGVAATDYKGGTYWPALWEAAGFQGTPQDAGDLGARVQHGGRPPWDGDVPRTASPLRRADLDARRHTHLLPG